MIYQISDFKITQDMGISMYYKNTLLHTHVNTHENIQSHTQWLNGSIEPHYIPRERYICFLIVQLQSLLIHMNTSYPHTSQLIVKLK